MPLLRAVVVWALVLAAVMLPHFDPPAATSTTTASITQLRSFDRTSTLTQIKAKRLHAAQDAQVQKWSSELSQGLAQYAAEQAALAEAQPIADSQPALNNPPPPPPYIAKIIYDAFSPLGARPVQGGINVASCASR